MCNPQAPRHISFKTGGLITGVLGILMLPWKLMATAGDYIFNWLIGYSMLLGPIAAIMIADYFVLRKKELDVPDLYLHGLALRRKGGVARNDGGEDEQHDGPHLADRRTHRKRQVGAGAAAGAGRGRAARATRPSSCSRRARPM